MSADSVVEQLAQRLSELEAVVASLPQGEQSYPSYLTVAADGSIAQLFPGGVSMQEALVIAGAPEPSHAVRWLYPTDQSIAAFIQGDTAIYPAPPFAGQRIHELRTRLAPAAFSPINTYVDLYMQSYSGGYGVLTANSGNNAQSASVKVIDSSDESGLLRATSDWGSSAWNGGSAVPNITIPRSGTYALIGECASCYNNGAGGNTGIALQWANGGNAFSLSWLLFFNVVNTHLRLNANWSNPTYLPAGVYTPTVTSVTGAFVADANDFFRVDLLRVGN